LERTLFPTWQNVN